MTYGLHLSGIRGFTVAKFHAAGHSHPWVGCKGSDTIVICKWLVFYVGLSLQEQSWGASDRQLLQWMLDGTRGLLSFSQGIHHHGVWLKPSCVVHLRRSIQEFGNCYIQLAAHCLSAKLCLFGLVPKLHAAMHFRSDFDDSLAATRRHTLNPALFDCSQSEDFVGRVSRASRRVSFRHIEKTCLHMYQIKARSVMKHFKRRHRFEEH